MVRIDGAWCKFQRAYDNLADLSAKISPYVESKPFRLDYGGQSESAAGEHVVRFVVTTRPEPIWAAQFGEVIHDLRSALDHAIYQLVLDNDQTPRARQSGFPICDKDSDFLSPGRARAGINLLRGVSDELLAVVTQCQPYQARTKGLDPHHMALWILNELWSIDKHRLLHLMVVGAMADSVMVRGTFPLDQVHVGSRKLFDGAEIVRYTVHPHNGGIVHVDVNVTSELIIEESMETPITYNDISMIGNEVRDVLKALSKFARERPPL